ncbi:translation initiation factor eIF-2B subunit delta-like isoform X2 [Varroa destructor]|uniref:Translation initiation factor eIF2B subunit delta n=1 Tax=Varroa destructor TaxID=109461 RepID=A0A7M7JP95_VARDE|nr:translation initiation factor eIF-2B subunit delta-like isoform X2 [Varroa destructor]
MNAASTMNRGAPINKNNGGKKKKKKSKNNKKNGQAALSISESVLSAEDTIGINSTFAPTLKETTPARIPEVSIIPLNATRTNSFAPTVSAIDSSASTTVVTSQKAGGDEASKKKKKRKKKKKKTASDAKSSGAGDAKADGPAVTVIPLNKDPGAIPAHLNPAVAISQRAGSQGPKVIECSPVVTLIGTNKKAKGHGALYNPPNPLKVHTPAIDEEPLSNEQVQTIGGGFRFPSSLQPVFETPESIAVNTGVVLNQETSGVLTIVPVRQEGEKKRRNRNKILPPCCELRGSSGLEVVCPHSNKPIPNYNFIVNEDREKSRQLQETQESLQHIDDPEVLDSLASIDHSVTIKLVGGRDAPQTTVHRQGDKNTTILVQAADAMKKNVPNNNSGAVEQPTVNNTPPGDADKAKKARLKAERKAAFEAKRAAELAATGDDGKENKKDLSKAQRRAIQEAQRAKKAQAKEASKGGEVKTAENRAAVPPTSKTRTRNENSLAADKKKELNSSKKVSFADIPSATTPFVHMHTRGESINKLSKYSKDLSLHPAMLQLGYQIAEGRIVDADNRCTAMLEALQKLVEDFGTRKDQEKKDIRQLSKELGSQMDKNIEFLEHCRPLSVSMLNALSYVKTTMGEECTDMRTASEFATNIKETIIRFVEVEIGLARRAIVANAKDKITDGDVVLIYASSTLISEILLACHEEGKQFSVVVVDSRPRLEGRETLRLLCKEGIRCKYIFINSVSYIMKEVTKVLLSADTLLANGYVASKIGSSQIAMIATTFNVPVLVCCETYKFSDKVLADPFVDNELGSTDDFLLNLSEERRISLRNDLPSRVSLVDLTYDITPPEFVTVVVTERGSLPCTSVPVVLRVRQNVLQ